jgi:SET domain-containing protein
MATMVLVPPSDCWVHPAVQVRRSPIEGFGLFATERVAVGTIVLQLGGQLVSDDELQLRLAAAAADPTDSYVDTITVEQDIHLVIPPDQSVHYGNHSCDPNLWYVDPYSFSARRDIESGQELTNDYATTTGVPGWEMDCRCGSSVCRRQVTGRDWSSPELQDRYGPHWTPGLRRRIAGA